MLQGKHYRFTIPDMNTWEMVKYASRKAESWAVSAESWAVSMVNALPPYYVREGILESKRVDDSGRYIILVNGEPISIDRPTYHILDVGEHIRVGYTRGARAISIDRFMDSDGPY